MKIPFNKPFLTGKETGYIEQAFASGKVSGDGMFTARCHTFFEQKFGFKKVLLTTSCTDALEMAAILLDIKEGDEVVMPAFTFVSTANAFVLRGAKVVFVDSSDTHPGLDENKLRKAISEKTRAIVVVHYAGIACNMEEILRVARENELYVVEDAAQAIDSYFVSPNGKKQPLGTMGHLATFSFHETKNISSGEGGMLAINDEQFIARAEIIREKGTDRSAFFRGEVEKYGWQDIGSSFLPSDLIAAFLFAQLEQMEQIQEKRLELWREYDKHFRGLLDKGYGVRLPWIPGYATNNAHLYYLVTKNNAERNALLTLLNYKDIGAVFHYQSLHNSAYYTKHYDGVQMPNSRVYSDCLIRLPLFYELTPAQQAFVVATIIEFYRTYR